MTHWATHNVSAEDREQKYKELESKGILTEVEKLFMAKEVKILGGIGRAKKEEKKQIIPSDTRKNICKPFFICSKNNWPCFGKVSNRTI